MKEILDYISNNNFLTTIIGVLCGGMITTLTTIFIDKKNEKKEITKEIRRQFENKAELRITTSTDFTDNCVPNIEIFFTTFEHKYMKNKNTHKFIYPQHILNNKSHRYKNFYIKNIGNSDVSYIDVCTNNKKNTALFAYSSLETIVNNNYIDYNYCYDKKILKGETIIVRIYYLDGINPCDFLSSSLGILYKDSFNNLYKQTFWFQAANLYEPSKISYKEYRSCVTIDDAMNCFEHPYLW